MPKKQALLLQMEMFNEMSSHSLSPNQYYLLCCMRDSVSPFRINLHLELRALVVDGWVTKENVLTKKSIELIDSIERIFSLSKKRTSRQLMGKDFKGNIAKYREMFPNMKLPNGKPARTAPGNLEKAFIWFFNNYKYEWDLIFRATAKYLNDYQKKNYKFMRTSQFFIRKNDISDLADMCDALQSGGYQEDKPLFSTKVV